MAPKYGLLGDAPRLLPPGPPPGRPPARLPPGPPPGVPPGAVRLPGAPPPPGTVLRQPPGLQPIGATGQAAQSIPLPHESSLVDAASSNILSAPPSITKPRMPAKLLPIKKPEDQSSTITSKARAATGATIEAKAQIKNPIGDVTKFMPTSVKVKRDVRDARGRIIKKKDEPRSTVVASTVNRSAAVAHPGQTKDDAYAQFMHELEDLF